MSAKQSNGTGQIGDAGEKIRCAKLLVDELDLSKLPRPFAGLVSRLLQDCSTGAAL
jgi:hypothetical protein